MNRRTFIKRGALLVPAAIAFPNIVSAERFPPGALVSSKKPAAAGGATYILQENFEDATVGWDNSNANGWTASGAGFDPKYATSPAPLVGTQSAKADLGEYGWTTFAANGEVWFSCRLNITALSGASSPHVLNLRIGTAFPAAVLVIVDRGNSDRVSISVEGGTPVLTTTSFSAATSYDIRVHYKKGSGANAVADVEFQPVGTGFSGSGNNFAQVTNGSATGDVDHIYLQHTADNGNKTIWDTIRISTTGF